MLMVNLEGAIRFPFGHETRIPTELPRHDGFIGVFPAHCQRKYFCYLNFLDSFVV
jgi:hypothetical protein